MDGRVVGRGEVFCSARVCVMPMHPSFNFTLENSPSAPASCTIAVFDHPEQRDVLPGAIREELLCDVVVPFSADFAKYDHDNVVLSQPRRGCHLPSVSRVYRVCR